MLFRSPGMENTNGTVGVVSVADDADITVQVADSAVVVAVGAPRRVAVYDVAGREVAAAFVSADHSFALPCGVYLVEGVKVVVK